MSTIKSRWKWIRREAYVVLFLTVLFVFPQLPGQLLSLVRSSGLTGVVVRFFSDPDAPPGYGGDIAMTAETAPRFKPVAYPVRTAAPSTDNPSAATGGPDDSTEVFHLTLEDAMLLESSDPNTARAVYEAAAEHGDRLAQVKTLELEGAGPARYDLYLSALFERQKLAHAWRAHFEDALRALHNQVDQGNPTALEVLNDLSKDFQ